MPESYVTPSGISLTRAGSTQTKPRIQVDAALAEIAWHSVNSLHRCDKAPVGFGALQATQ
jgi:hypothetical protein